MNGHERILLLAAAAIDFPLAPEEADGLEAHLRSCDACRSAAAHLRGDAALIAALPRSRPSDEAGQRIVEAARGPQRTSVRPSLALIAVALLLAAALIGAAIAGALLLRTRDLPFSLVPPSPQATVVPTSVAPTSTPAPTPTPTIPPGETWQVATLSGSPGMSGVVAGGPGWIGVGGGAWTSSDGRTWKPATVEGVEPCAGSSRCSGMTEVAAGVGGFVAIGEDPTALREGRPQSGLIWHSVDGLVWLIVGSGPEFELGPCIEGCPSMHGVAGGPAGFVAFGYRIVSEAPLRTAVVAWFSPDGQRWETLPIDTFDSPGSAVALSSVAAGPSGFVIAGSTVPAEGPQATERPAFWMSTDGRTWAPTGPDGASRQGAVPYGIVAGGLGFVAVGGCPDATCGIAWTSPDGSTWTQHPIGASEGPSRADEVVASDGHRVIAFSDAGTAVWTSDDGLEWTRHDVDAAPIHFEAVAGGERGFLAMGLDKAETAFSIWLSP